MERNQPQFPVRRGCTERRHGNELMTGEGQGRSSQGQGRADEEQSERQPLLSAAAANYASVGMQQPSSDTWQSPDGATTAMLPPPPPYS